MKEQKPTYEEKLQALKESIEHWEKDILPDTDKAYNEDKMAGKHCPLCRLKMKYGINDCSGCPIYEKTKAHSCWGSPWLKFVNEPTKENALAEVVFLKNLYIEMLEKGKPRNFCVDCKHWVGGKCVFIGKCGHRPEEKKEEWVDVTDNLTWVHTRKDKNGFGLLEIFDDEIFIGHFSLNNLYIAEDNYRQEEHSGRFCILKKVS